MGAAGEEKGVHGQVEAEVVGGHEELEGAVEDDGEDDRREHAHFIIIVL